MASKQACYFLLGRMVSRKTNLETWARVNCIDDLPNSSVDFSQTYVTCLHYVEWRSPPANHLNAIDKQLDWSRFPLGVVPRYLFLFRGIYGWIFRNNFQNECFLILYALRMLRLRRLQKMSLAGIRFWYVFFDPVGLACCCVQSSGTAAAIHAHEDSNLLRNSLSKPNSLSIPASSCNDLFR